MSLYRYKLILFCWFMAGLAVASEPGIREQFTDSRVMYESIKREESYQLVLSIPRKVNSRWSFDRVERISGTVSRQTFEIGNTYSFDDSEKRLEKFFRAEQGRLIFSCNGMDCGSSNAWANEVFNVKQLYGLDPQQQYFVWELVKQGETPQYIVSYLVQRGNRRVYLQFDQITPTNHSAATITADPNAIVNQLLTHGYYVVPGVAGLGQQNPHIDTIATALKMRPSLSVVLVGHSYTGKDVDSKIKNSKVLAQSLEADLQKLGVDEKQIQARGVGSLAPQGKVGVQRVELVVP